MRSADSATPFRDPYRPRVYLVEDDAIVRHGSEQALLLASIDVKAFDDAESALLAFTQAGEHERPWAVVSDLRLPGMDGLDLMRQLRRREPNLPVILVTGHGDVATAVEAMREGAADFIEKPFASERLVQTVRRAVARRGLEAENARLREQLHAVGLAPLLGTSVPMQLLRQLIATVAPSRVDVLINGETGAGKEVVARCIHSVSGRLGPFVALNCAALPETMIESELFGHEAGAFTGAARRRIGRIEHANGGTLFLDEIESMSPAVQVKLLRVLQERQLERLGSNELQSVDCRVIAASKEDLKALAATGRFRADLYYRLNVVSVNIPALRDRPGDVPLLMAHFVGEAARRHGVPESAWSEGEMLQWQQHDWPGNVRELRNVAERLALGVADRAELDAPATSLSGRVDQFERRLIEDALRSVDGHVARAADLLHVPRKTLYDKLNRHGITPSAFAAGPVAES